MLLLLVALLKSDTHLARSDFLARDRGLDCSRGSSVTVKTIFISGLLLLTVGVTNLFFTGFETTMAEVALGAFAPDIVSEERGVEGEGW